MGDRPGGLFEVLEAVSEPTLLVSTEGSCLAVNAAAERVFHISRDEARGRPISEVLSDERGVVRGELSTHAESFKYLHAPSSHAFEIRVIRADGAVWLVARETRERREQQQRYQALVEALDDGYCVIQMLFDAEGQPIDYRFLEVNAAFVRHTGLVDAVGKTARELVPNIDPSWFRFYGNVAVTGRSARYENHEPSLQRWFEVFAERVGDPGLRQLGVIFKDVTVRREAQEARQRAVEELAQRVAFEQQLVGIVSHDLRSPLSAMVVGASALLDTAHPNAQVTRGLCGIVASGERADRLIRDLLDFSQARLGTGIPVHRRQMNLHQVAKQLVAESQQVHPEREIVLRREGRGVGRWDPDRVAQAIGNLLANAIQYGDPAKRVRVRTAVVDGAAVVEVANEGPPISADELKTIFQPLSRGEGQLDIANRSIGLGLFIVDQIARAHRGSIEARSTADQTVFTLRLPDESGRAP